MKGRNEVSVGILITTAVILLVLGALWLAHGGLKSGYPLYTRFTWGQNLKQGQPVLLAGVSVGYVGDVTLRRNGYLDVMLKIDDQFTVPKGSTATVKPVGIFGDVAVALNPPVPPPAASYNPGDTVPPGPPAADIGQIMNHVDTISQTVAALTLALKEQVIEAGTLKDIHRTVASAAAASAQLQGILAEQNRNVTATMAAFREAATHLSGVVDSTKINASLENMRQTTANLARLTASADSTNTQLRALLVQARTGNGTVGKFMSDSMLYADTRRLLIRMDSLVADFKNNPKKYINVHVF